MAVPFFSQRRSLTCFVYSTICKYDIYLRMADFAAIESLRKNFLERILTIKLVLHCSFTLTYNPAGLRRRAVRQARIRTLRETESWDAPVYLIKDELTDSSGNISKEFDIPRGDLAQVRPMKLR